jgi:hypothetical protein
MFDGDFESKCCIARQQQLERLEAWLQSANCPSSQKSTAYFIQASPGMGKTFLFKMLIVGRVILSNIWRHWENLIWRICRSSLCWDFSMSSSLIRALWRGSIYLRLLLSWREKLLPFYKWLKIYSLLLLRDTRKRGVWYSSTNL